MEKGIRFEVDVEKLMANKDKVSEKYLKDPNLLLPSRATKGSAGYDLKYPYNHATVFDVHQSILLDSFVKIILPQGYVANMYVRSSIGVKKGLVLSNGTGIIDSDFRDSIKIPLINISDKSTYLLNGDDVRVAQIVISKYETVDYDNVEVERTGGIGSTDK